MKPLISIIVPLYNVEPYLAKCIDSILAQTFNDFELILVNDGSSDNSGFICDAYARGDCRVIVIHKENGGVSSARNAGLKVAKGRYIGFVDSDDYIDRTMYEILINHALLHSADVVVCDFLKVSVGETQDRKVDTKNIGAKHYSNIESLYQLFSKGPDKAYITGAGNNVKWIVLWNKLYKREVFHNLTFKEGSICEDEFIIHQVLFNSTKTIYLSDQLYYYVQSPNSIIRSYFSKKRLDKVYALKERADFFIKIKEKKLHYMAYKSFVESFYWNYYKAKAEQGNFRGELKNLKRTFDKSILFLLKNPLIGWKQKLFSVFFIMNPFV